jgi:sec-independent protein translocase protein TatB
VLAQPVPSLRGYPGSVFDSIGWGEIVVLALAALFIFGPDRLPGLAKEAAQGLKKVREAITGVRQQVSETMGDDFAELRDIDLRKYHPKTFIREQLLGDDDSPPVRRGTSNGSAGLLDGATGAAPAAAVARPRDAATPPPFDPDAT